MEAPRRKMPTAKLYMACNPHAMFSFEICTTTLHVYCLSRRLQLSSSNWLTLMPGR